MNSYKRLKKIHQCQGKLNECDKQLHFLCMIIKNFLEGPLEGKYNDYNRLKKYKNILKKLAQPLNRVSYKQKRRVINQQGSGFLPLLLPILISTLWNTISTK